MTGILYDQRKERFCQLIASGLPPRQAHTDANCPKSWPLKRLLTTPPTSARIDELMAGAAKRAELTRKYMIDEVHQEWKLARLAGQHSAALKAAEMLGGELHGMFRKQVEIGRPGEFDGMNAEQLREYILEQLKELGINPDNLGDESIKLIDAKPLDEDEDIHSNEVITKQDD